MQKNGSIGIFELKYFGEVFELAIIEFPEMYEAWMAKKGYGISEFVLGCKKKQTIYNKEHEIDWNEFANMAINYSDKLAEDILKKIQDEDESGE